MKYKTKKRIMGSITVLLVIILLPMMTFSAVIVDSSRINMARSMVSSAGDLTMNTALANYDTIMKDVYGLFAMSQELSDEELSKKLKDYFATTLCSYGVVDEAHKDEYTDKLIGDLYPLIAGVEKQQDGASNFLSMNADAMVFNAQRAEGSALSNPGILRSQIVEYMKYRAPVNFGMSFFDSINSFNTIDDQQTVIDSQVQAQEKTQDVARACKALIDKIRQFDDTYLKYDLDASFDGTVKGKDNKNDGAIVRVSDYIDQPLKYENGWNTDNYATINKIAQVFLRYAPEMLKNDGIYLRDTTDWHNDTTKRFIYMKDGTYGVYTNGSGISVSSPYTGSAADNFKSALSAVTSSSISYTNRIKSQNASLSDLDKSITNFTAFENYLKDNYPTEAKPVLEKIYILKLCYDSYISELNSAISDAQSKKDEAQKTVNSANSAKTNATNSFNTALKNMNDTLGSLSGMVDTTGQLWTVLNIGVNFTESGVKYENYNFAQTITDMSEQTITGSVSSFNKSQFLFNSSDTNTKYFITASRLAQILSSSYEYKELCEKTIEYIKDDEGKSYSSYISKTANDGNRELYNIFMYLFSCNSQADKVQSTIGNYDTKANDAADAQNKLNEATAELNKKTSEKNSAVTDYGNALSNKQAFTNSFQDDLYYFKQCIQNANASVNEKAGAISSQMRKIKSALNFFVTTLGQISTLCTTAYNAIKTYNDKLDAWNTANENYEKNNDNKADSFSKQNTEDIKSFKQQYNLESVMQLKDYADTLKGVYQSLLDLYFNSSNFTYCNTSIADIQNSDKVKQLIGSFHVQADTNGTGVITAEEAANVFGSLYKGKSDDYTIPDDPDMIVLQNEVNTQMTLNGGGKITSPTYSVFIQESSNGGGIGKIVPIAFLAYLAQTYPKGEETPASVTVKDEDGNNKDVNIDFDQTKKDLNDNSGKEIDDDTPESSNSGDKHDKYGYTYKYKGNLDKSGLPSENSQTSGEVRSTMSFDVNDKNDIDMSSGTDKQKSVLSAVLGGLGNIAEYELENAYVMDYIFENFSYNTKVQEKVLENTDNNSGLDNVLSILTKTNTYMTDENIKAAVLETVSGYDINAYNNYLYGAEVEYMLYGNASPSTNVAFAKGSIYAIRFAFNCIFAFTNSEIRNITRNAGIAVQTATLGVVPYIVVQVVLQLAFAAGESAIDLQAMSLGAKIPVVKTKDTWALSPSGALNAVGELAGSVVETAVKKGVSKLQEGLQNFLDASADKVKDSVDGLKNNLTEATKGKLQEVVDSVANYAVSNVENVLNSLQYTNYDKLTVSVSDYITEQFNTIREKLSAESLKEAFDNNEMVDLALNGLGLESIISDAIGNIEQQVKTEIEKREDNVNIAQIIFSKINKWKESLTTTINDKIDSLSEKINNKADSVVDDVKSKIQDTVEKYSGEISEDMAKKLKKEVTDSTNDFINKYLDEGASDSLSGGLDESGVASSKKSLGSTVASMIKFGYSDYLKLFVFINLNIESSANALLCRMADCIQLNIQNAKSPDASYQHKLTTDKGSTFKMMNAYTYININADVKLDMLFMDMGFFADMVTDNGSTTSVNGGFDGTTITFKSLYGY